MPVSRRRWTRPGANPGDDVEIAGSVFTYRPDEVDMPGDWSVDEGYDDGWEDDWDGEEVDGDADDDPS